MITLDLPAPPSVNRSRRIDWREHKNTAKWLKHADGLFLLQKRKLGAPIEGRFEITVTLREDSAMDLDNGIKAAIDAVRRFKLVTDDSPEFMRRVVVEFGEAPEGCRVTVKPFPEAPV